MAKIRKMYDEAIKPDGSKQVIYPITSTRAVYTTNNVTIDAILGEGYRFGGVVLPTDSPTFTDQRVFYGASVPGIYTNFGNIAVDGGEAIFLMFDGTSWRKGIFGGAGSNNLTGFKSLASISDLPLEETTLGYLIKDETVPAGLANEFLYVWVGEHGDTLDGLYQNCGQLRGASAYEVAVRNGYEGTETEWLKSLYNPPDEEDITRVTENGNDVLKFKNRSAVDGMGYVILRKGGSNTFANQVTAANTIYEIRYDFDLDGETVTIPGGCVLYFNGGKLRNGGLVLDDTLFEGGDIACEDISISGTIKNDFIKTKWFLPGTTGLRDFLVMAISSTDVKKIIINEGEYDVSGVVDLRSNIEICGDGEVILNVPNLDFNFSLVDSEHGNPNVFQEIYTYSNVVIRNLKFNYHTTGGCNVIGINNAENVLIDNCKFIDDNVFTVTYATEAIIMTNCRYCTVSNCHSEYVRLWHPLFCVYCTAYRNVGYQSPGTWLETNDGFGIIYDSNILRGNTFDSNSSISQNSDYGVIRNNEIYCEAQSASNITLGHDASGYYQNSAKNCLVEGNILEAKAGYAILTQNSDGAIIRGNRIKVTNCQAFHLGAGNVKIENNFVEAIATQDYGLILFDVRTPAPITISGNIINMSQDQEYSHQYVILGYAHSPSLFIFNNVFKVVTPITTTSIYFYSSHDVEQFVIKNNYFVGVRGFYVNAFKDLVIEGNVFESLTGVLFENVGKTSALIKRVIVTKNIFNWVYNYPNDAMIVTGYYDTSEKPVPIVIAKDNLTNNSNTRLKISLKDVNENAYPFNGQYWDNHNVCLQANRPSPGSYSVGYQAYDATLNKPIWWTGTKWVLADGSDAPSN